MPEESRDYIGSEPSLPGKPTSLWIDTVPATRHPRLEGRTEADVCVVGGGLVGALTATLLADAGMRVVVVDAHRLGLNVTGHTTAKVTVQHGLIYDDLVRRHGEHAALVYAEANLAGLNRIRSLVRRYGVDCALETAASHVFTQDERRLDDLRREAETAQRLGLPASYAEEPSAPYGFRAAVRFEDQAQFHPLRFMLGLLERAGEGRVRVFERTRALGVREGEPSEVVTESGTVVASHVVVATQFPFYDRGAFFSRLYPMMSHAMALRVRGDSPAGTWISAEAPEHAVRAYPGPSDRWLVISGEDHRTGHGGDETGHYRALEGWARERFDVEEITHHWSTEDYDTPDRLPYVGRSPGSERVYLAAGFGGWGMTNSAMSAILISDLVLGRDNPWAEVFDPSRMKPRASASAFLKANASTAKSFVSGTFGAARVGVPEDVRPGTGTIMSVEGRHHAVYRDPDGTLHDLEPKCAHMGCPVTFNDAEKTWDCTCHGSRYAPDGHVVHGPAQRGLSPAKARQPSPAR